MLSKDIIENVVDLGFNEFNTNYDPKNIISSFTSSDELNRKSPDFWNDLSENLNDLDLISFFKGMVILERELEWIGGSVSAGIWIYKRILKRNLDIDNRLADWALQNSRNPYIPFGHSRYSDHHRTFKGYIDNENKINKQRAINLLLEEKRQQRVKNRKLKRKEQIANFRQLNYEQIKETKSKLLNLYSNSSIEEKFSLIIEDEKFPPEYYPVEWSKVKSEDIGPLPNYIIKGMFDKLSTKSRGSWRRLRNLLEKFDDGF